MDYLGGSVDVFLVSSSKESKHVIIYDGINQDKKGKLRVIESNLDKALNKKVLHGFKRIQGGAVGSRNLCVVEHDDGIQSIYEYYFNDEKTRKMLLFALVLTLEPEYMVCSSLINNNKIVVRDVKANMNDQNHYCLNIDMKVYWRLPDYVEEIFDHSKDARFFYIPDSAYDGLLIN